MLNEPPEKTIASITAVLLACEKRGAIRDYAGFAPGKRRRLEVCRYIAGRIAPRYFFPIAFRDGDREVPEAELIEMLADVLRSIPDEQAYLLVSTNNDHRMAIRDMIAKRMAKRCRAAYQMSQLDNTAGMVRINDPTRPAHADESKAYQERMRSLAPRYRWQRTDIYLPNFTGFDAGQPFARIWCDYSKGDETWQWECTAEFPRRLNSPPSGGADITRQAARDAEDYYDRLKAHNDLHESKP